MLCDPHAAQIILDCDIPKTMFGLNVTHQVIATPKRIQAMRDIGNDSGRVLPTCPCFLKRFTVRDTDSTDQPFMIHVL